jgi:hypothetical protein
VGIAHVFPGNCLFWNLQAPSQVHNFKLGQMNLVFLERSTKAERENPYFANKAD